MQVEAETQTAEPRGPGRTRAAERGGPVGSRGGSVDRPGAEAGVEGLWSSWRKGKGDARTLAERSSVQEGNVLLVFARETADEFETRSGDEMLCVSSVGEDWCARERHGALWAGRPERIHHPRWFVCMCMCE
jgi:hypothetical protein